MMLQVKPKELSTTHEFEASLSWYFNLRLCHSISMGTKTSLAQFLQDDMEEERWVLKIRPEISPVLGLWFKSYPQYGRNTNVVWAGDHQNLGVNQEQNSPSVDLQHGQAEFHGCYGSKIELRKTPTESHSKVFNSWISTHHQGCKFQCTRKAEWMRRGCFIFKLFIQRRTFLSEAQTEFSEF